MKLSKHASERWQERFPDKCAESEFMKARLRLTRKEFKSLRSRLTHPMNIARCRPQFRDVYYRKTKAGIVFVIAPGELVVTAFPLKPSKEISKS